ncbi:MAG TPA: hypothetical protein VMK13_00165 [Streptosporangiaceae bacterium]|nr:hypothetical protein [Streptosporangiaceae bacterium]
MIGSSGNLGAGPVREASSAARDLAALREAFPRFRVWREAHGDRVRYVARRVRPGAGPHTVVAADLAEMRAALEAGPGRAASRFSGMGRSR